MKRFVRVPVGLVDVANAEGWERSLAYWFQAKSKYQNSCIYNFTLRKLAQLLNISHECARHHFNVWVNKGIVKEHCGNLTFCGLETLNSVASRSNELTFYNVININITEKISDQIKILKARCVLKNINQQLRHIRLNRETVQNLQLAERKKYLTKDEYKLYKKALKRELLVGKQRLKSYNTNVSLSDKKISELVGCSLSYAKSLKKYMNESGLVTATKVNGDLVGRMSYRSFLSVREYTCDLDGCFYHKGNVYHFPTTTYSIGYAASGKAWEGKI